MSFPAAIKPHTDDTRGPTMPQSVIRVCAWAYVRKLLPDAPSKYMILNDAAALHPSSSVVRPTSLYVVPARGRLQRSSALARALTVEKETRQIPVRTQPCRHGKTPLVARHDITCIPKVRPHVCARAPRMLQQKDPTPRT